MDSRSNTAKQSQLSREDKLKTDFAFVAMPLCVLFDERLNRYDKLVYLHLITRAQNHEGEVVYPQETLVRDTGLGITRVKQSLIMLDRAGLISIVRQRQQLNRYMIVPLEQIYTQSERQKTSDDLLAGNPIASARDQVIRDEQNQKALRRSSAKLKPKSVVYGRKSWNQMSRPHGLKERSEAVAERLSREIAGVVTGSQLAREQDELWSRMNTADDTGAMNDFGFHKSRAKSSRDAMSRSKKADKHVEADFWADSGWDDIDGLDWPDADQSTVKTPLEADFWGDDEPQSDLDDVDTDLELFGMSQPEKPVEKPKAKQKTKKEKYSDRRNKDGLKGLKTLARLQKANAAVEQAKSKKSSPKKTEAEAKQTKPKSSNDLPEKAEVVYSKNDAKSNTKPKPKAKSKAKAVAKIKATDVAQYFRDAYQKHLNTEFPAPIPTGINARNSQELGGWNHVLKRYGWDRLTQTIDYVLANWSSVAGRLGIVSWPTWNMLQSYKIMDAMVIEAQMGKPQVTSKWDQIKTQKSGNKMSAAESPDDENWRNASEHGWDAWVRDYK